MVEVARHPPVAGAERLRGVEHEALHVDVLGALERRRVHPLAEHGCGQQRNQDGRDERDRSHRRKRQHAERPDDEEARDQKYEAAHDLQRHIVRAEYGESAAAPDERHHEQQAGRLTQAHHLAQRMDLREVIGDCVAHDEERHAGDHRQNALQWARHAGTHGARNRQHDSFIVFRIPFVGTAAAHDAPSPSPRWRVARCLRVGQPLIRCCLARAAFRS